MHTHIPAHNVHSYKSRDPYTAGVMTRRETGLLVEIVTEAALRAGKNIWVDGSLRDGE